MRVRIARSIAAFFKPRLSDAAVATQAPVPTAAPKQPPSKTAAEKIIAAIVVIRFKDIKFIKVFHILPEHIARWYESRQASIHLAL